MCPIQLYAPKIVGALATTGGGWVVMENDMGHILENFPIIFFHKFNFFITDCIF